MRQVINFFKKFMIFTMMVCTFLSNNIFYVHANLNLKQTENRTGGEMLAEWCKNTYESSVQNGISEEEKEMIRLYNNVYIQLRSEASKGEMYPDYVAGMYCDEQDGVVICLDEHNKQAQSKLLKLKDKFNEINYCYVKNSYKELESLKVSIEKKCNEIMKTGSTKAVRFIKRIISIGIDEEKNRIVVGVDNYSKVDKSLFWKYISKSKDVFLYNGEAQPCTTTLMPGQRIYGDRIEGDGWIEAYSLGCRAWRITSSGEYQYGFITAGHGNYEGTKFYFNNSLSKENCIGYVAQRQCKDTVDAAFVVVENSDVIVSNNPCYTMLDLKPRSYIVSNFGATTCVFSGASSGRIKFGKVISEDTKTSWNEYAGDDSSKCDLNGLLSVKFDDGKNIIAGDSGGLLFGMVNNANCVMGIASGTGTYSYFVKYSEILDEMKWYIY